jgi:hypothetical protein
MSNIFKNLKYFILSFREKHLMEKLKHTTKRSFANKTGKKVYGHGAELTLQSETKKLVEQVRENVSAIVKSTNCDPNALLDYVKVSKTPVFRINNADKILNLIREEEGFICEKHGFDALYLSLTTQRKFTLKTEPMFVLRDGEIDKFYLLHNFYRWYSMKSGLAGFEYEVQKKFKLSLFDKTNTEMNNFSMEDIISIKEAVARDQEATEFVLQYTKHLEGSKNVLTKLKNEGGANI